VQPRQARFRAAVELSWTVSIESNGPDGKRPESLFRLLGRSLGRRGKAQADDAARALILIRE
jgi:hypothetical protein